MAVKEKHPHYHKNVRHLNDIDIYRVLERFGVTDPTIQHAVKKLLVAGGRGAGKGQDQDVQEAIDSLLRFQEMRVENEGEFNGAAPRLTTVVNVLDPETLRNHLNSDVGQEAIRRFITGGAPVKRAKKMPTSVKKDLAKRKATKRATKAAPRRGR